MPVLLVMLLLLRIILIPEGNILIGKAQKSLGLGRLERMPVILVMLLLLRIILIPEGNILIGKAQKSLGPRGRGGHQLCWGGSFLYFPYKYINRILIQQYIFIVQMKMKHHHS